MNKSAIRLLTLAMYAMALIAVPLTTAYAAGGDNPSPPASDTKDTKKVKKKKDKSSSIDDPPASTIRNSLRAIARPMPRFTTATTTARRSSS